MITFDRLEDLTAEARSMGEQYEAGLAEQRVVKESWIVWVWLAAILVTMTWIVVGVGSQIWNVGILLFFSALSSFVGLSMKFQNDVMKGLRDSLGIFSWSESTDSRKRRADAASSARHAQGRIVWLAEMIEVHIARAFESDGHLVVVPHYEPGQHLLMGLEKTEVLTWIDPLGDPKRANPLVKVIHPSGKEEIMALTINQDRELVLIGQFKQDRSWKLC